MIISLSEILLSYERIPRKRETKKQSTFTVDDMIVGSIELKGAIL